MNQERRQSPTLPIAGGRRWQDRQFLKVEDIAEKLSVRVSTVRKWIKVGTLTAHKFGSDIRIDVADAEAYIARCQVKSA